VSRGGLGKASESVKFFLLLLSSSIFVDSSLIRIEPTAVLVLYWLECFILYLFSAVLALKAVCYTPFKLE